MSSDKEPSVTSAEVVNRIRSEIERPSGAFTETDIVARVARVRSMQRDLRIEPLGGRLLPLKKILYWFVASAFDRQAKVVEALLDVVREIGEENERLRAEVQHLRAATDDLRRSADGSPDAAGS